VVAGLVYFFGGFRVPVEPSPGEAIERQIEAGIRENRKQFEKMERERRRNGGSGAVEDE